MVYIRSSKGHKVTPGPNNGILQNSGGGGGRVALEVFEKPPIGLK